MTTLYVVHCIRSGYAREDEGHSEVIGVYTDDAVAKNVALLMAAEVRPIELDHIYYGIREKAQEFGIVLPD